MNGMRPAALLASITLAFALPSVVHAECPGQTTREMEECLATGRDEATASLERYEKEVLRLLSDSPEVTEAFAASQTAWHAYAKAECQAVYLLWEEGSIRNVQFVACQLHLTSDRTWSLWSTYLRGMVTELPEPPRTHRGDDQDQETPRQGDEGLENS